MVSLVSLQVDPMLVVVSVLVPLLLIFINMIAIARYLHPDDVSGAKFPKFVVLFGMLFAECAVLLLPLDVGNRGGVVGCGYWNNVCGGLDMDLVWQMVYVIIAGFVIVLLPFTIFYYEADDRDARQKEWIWWTATKYLLVTMVISVAALVITYVFLRQTYIPYQYLVAGTNYENTWYPLNVSATTAMACGFDNPCTPTDGVIQMDVTFVIYLAGLLTFIGWVLFMFYAAIGMIALPMDLINAFIHRRKLLSDAAVVRFQKALQGRTLMLVEMSELLKEEMDTFAGESHSRSERRRQNAAHQVQLNKLKVLVDTLEVDAEDLRMSSPSEFKNNNPLTPWLKLLFGIISLVVSLVWIVHVVIYMLLDVTPFLNDYLIWFDGWFPLFGTLTVGFMAMYLLVAVVKGNFKFGVRFFLIKIHPIVEGKTFVNSMIFNLMLVQLCVLPVVQFTSEAFADYARLTSADVIFGSQIKHMEFFRYFFENNIFLYALLLITFLALIYFVASPSEKKRLAKEEMMHREALASSRDAAIKSRERQRR